MFRFACQLSEWIDRDILQQATERSLDVFPIFRSVLKHGLFWYYLEKTELVPVVEPEYRPPCGQIYDPSSRNLLFEVSCYRNRINLEVYHSLTDGTGALQFLKTLVCNYLAIKYPPLKEDLCPRSNMMPRFRNGTKTAFPSIMTLTTAQREPKAENPASSKVFVCRRADSKSSKESCRSRRFCSLQNPIIPPLP